MAYPLKVSMALRNDLDLSLLVGSVRVVFIGQRVSNVPFWRTEIKVKCKEVLQN